MSPYRGYRVVELSLARVLRSEYKCWWVVTVRYKSQIEIRPALIE